LDLRTLQPLDTDAIFASVKKTGRAIIYQKTACLVVLQVIFGIIMEQCFEYLDAPVKRASLDTPIPLQKH
jgi:2-oxoisovalerate dehydrogenase E1 component